MASILFRNVGPAGPRDLPKARALRAELEDLKEQLLPLDQSSLDGDRKRGSLELAARPVEGLGVVLGEMRVDAYHPDKPLRMLRVGISNEPGSCDGTFVAGTATQNYEMFVDRDDRQQETLIAHKHDRATGWMQSIYVDVETGEIGYREERR